MIVLLWASAMGIDVGFSVWGSRQAQAMADTTALDLARYINLADNNTSVTGVQNYLNLKLANVDTDNASNAMLTVTAGLWSGGAFNVPSYGCALLSPPNPLEPPCNAVQVTAGQQTGRASPRTLLNPPSQSGHIWRRTPRRTLRSST
jgi:uncharacterized membrane protein